MKIPEDIRTLKIELTEEEQAMITTFEKEMSRPIVKVSTVRASYETPTQYGQRDGKENKPVTNGQNNETDKGKEVDVMEIKEGLERAKLNGGVKVKREFRVMTDEERPQEIQNI